MTIPCGIMAIVTAMRRAGCELFSAATSGIALGHRAAVRAAGGQTGVIPGYGGDEAPARLIGRDRAPKVLLFYGRARGCGGRLSLGLVTECRRPTCGRSRDLAEERRKSTSCFRLAKMAINEVISPTRVCLRAASGGSRQFGSLRGCECVPGEAPAAAIFSCASLILF